VALTGLPAENVSFQRQQPNFPPHKIANSAACSPDLASQFGGKYAKYATFATSFAFGVELIANR
jgi:hypothetical protein